MATVIRWLGAFGKGGSLVDALADELWAVAHNSAPLLRCRRHLRAAEHVRRGGAMVPRGNVGVVFSDRAIVRRYSSDVWSYRDRHGHLRRENPDGSSSPWTEVWVRTDNPEYFRGLVVRRTISATAWAVVWETARRLRLPVYRLRGRSSKLRLLRWEDYNA